MWINLAPLKKYRDFRLLFLSQTISHLGSMVSYVAVPYQVYEVTKSSFQVGLLSLFQLVPLLLFGLIGGQVADRMDRRKVILVCEIVMGVGMLLLALNALLPVPSLAVIFIATIIMQATNGFHRPAMDALTQKVVDAEDYASIGALSAFRYVAGSIFGPALGGLLIGLGGSFAAYLFDTVTFGLAVVMIYFLNRDLRDSEMMQWHPKSLLQNMREGFSYAVKRQELLGTYFIDIAAMTFAFPIALFPEMSEQWGGAKAAGILFSAMALGGVITTLTSGWTSRVRRHGRMVIIAAALWAACMIGMGFAHSLWIAVFWLVLAGGFDMISGLFRSVIWNETIPNTMRGRMSSLEMISYMSGPLLGNARAGWMAAKNGWHWSSMWGGGIAVFAVLVCAMALPKFWSYRSTAVK